MMMDCMIRLNPLISLNYRFKMNEFIHMMKHIVGLCGEPHPSLLMGGMGVIGYGIYYIKSMFGKEYDEESRKD